MPSFRSTNTVIIFSESFESRDFLRRQISELGMIAVCFENEAVCYDNIKPILPKIVIVQTDSPQVAWRFILARHSMKLACPLVVVSDILKFNTVMAGAVQSPVYFISNHHLVDRLISLISEITGRTDGYGEKQYLPLFLGQTNKISHIRSMLPSLSQSRDSVLVTGERGTGKELLVRIMAMSAKSEDLIVKIDCAELSPAMLANGWFEKKMNIDADSRPVTIFIDRVHLIPKQIQAEILLLIERADKWKDHHKSLMIKNVRFMATSETPIENLVRNDQFRKDLFYRLNVIPVFMPPLRERKEDIDLLMDYFIIDAAAGSGKCAIIPSRKARETLSLYHWPGNVEELKTYMRRVSIAGNESFIFDNQIIPKMRKGARDYFLSSASVEDLPKPHEIKNSLSGMHDLSLKGICDQYVSRTEKKLMKKALEYTKWNRKKAAQLLNISYKSMLNKMKAYDII